MTGKNKVDYAMALRKANVEASKHITEHFEAQSDLFAICPKCRTRIYGTLTHIRAHACDFSDVMGG